MQIPWKRAALLGALSLPLGVVVAQACACANRDRPPVAPIAAEDAATAGQEEKPTVQIGESSQGKTVALKTGDLLEVFLPANPTTGFEWVVAQNDAEFLKPHGATKFDVPSADAQGAPTTQRLQFRVLKSGETSLELVYKRPWEGDDDIADRWSANFEIE